MLFGKLKLDENDRVIIKEQGGFSGDEIVEPKIIAIHALSLDEKTKLEDIINQLRDKKNLQFSQNTSDTCIEVKLQRKNRLYNKTIFKSKPFTRTPDILAKLDSF